MVPDTEVVISHDYPADLWNIVPISNRVVGSFLDKITFEQFGFHLLEPYVDLVEINRVIPKQKVQREVKKANEQAWLQKQIDSGQKINAFKGVSTNNLVLNKTLKKIPIRDLPIAKMT